MVVIGRSGRKWEMPKIPISVWANYVIYIYNYYKEKVANTHRQKFR